MKKKTICIFFVLILSAVSLVFYFKPQPVFIEMTICNKNRETAHFILSASWYRHWGGKRTFEGEAWINDERYYTILPSNWRDNPGKDIIPHFLSNRRANDGGFAEHLYLLPLGDGFYRILILSWEDVNFPQTYYYGPARSREELELLPLIQLQQ